MKKDFKWIPANDGVDHINMYSKGLTLLSRVLSPFYPTAFFHPKHGFFASGEAYWYYIASGYKADSAREMWGFQAKQEGKKYARVESNTFREEIIEGIRLRIEQNLAIKKLFVESTLPLAHYYVVGPNGDIPVELEKFDWMVEAMEEIRREMKLSL